MDFLVQNHSFMEFLDFDIMLINAVAMLTNPVVNFAKRVFIYLLLNAIPLWTCEKAKACEHRESETCN